jgi:hypothetical protein
VPTPKQWAYREERIAQSFAAQWLSQAETGKRIGIKQPTTISIWNRDAAFREWMSRGLREARQDQLVEATKNAICVRAINGNPRYLEAFIQLYGGDHPEVLEGCSGSQGVPTVSIYGIVGIPSRADAARIGPNDIVMPPPAPQELLAANEGDREAIQVKVLPATDAVHV